MADNGSGEGENPVPAGPPTGLNYVFSSCKEQPEPAKTVVTGDIPSWLDGNLVGVGPGLFEINEYPFKHYSDGMALVTKFQIQNGKVGFHSKYLESDTFLKNIENGRIMVNEGGTMAVPDPKKNFFSKMADKFTTKSEPSDNCNVNVWSCYGGECFVVAEQKCIRRMDIKTLKTGDKVDMSQYVEHAGLVAAHLQTDHDGTQYGVATVIGSHPKFLIYKIPVPILEGGTETILNDIKVISEISGQFKVSPCYVHTFGMTERYIVLFENPFFVNVLKIVKQSILSRPILEAFDFDPEAKTRIHVLRKDTGEEIMARYIAEPTASFHHINCYEDKHHLVVDLVCMKEPVTVLKNAYLSSLRETGGLDYGEAKRYVIPLQLPGPLLKPLNETKMTLEDQQAQEEEEKKKKKKNKKPEYTKDNLVSLPAMSASAHYVQEDGSIMCTPETLSEPGFEKPQINPANYTSRYTFFYATGGYSRESPLSGSICKVNVSSKTMIQWKAGANEYPQEAIFVANPNAATEDDGVLLSPVIHAHPDTPDYLVVLNASSMTEVGRATLPKDARVPPLNHEIFLPDKHEKSN